MAGTLVHLFLVCAAALWFGHHGTSAGPVVNYRCGSYYELPPYKFPTLDEHGDVVEGTERPATRRSPVSTTPSAGPSEEPAATENPKSRSARSLDKEGVESDNQKKNEVTEKFVRQCGLTKEADSEEKSYVLFGGKKETQQIVEASQVFGGKKETQQIVEAPQPKKCINCLPPDTAVRSQGRIKGDGKR